MSRPYGPYLLKLRGSGVVKKVTKKRNVLKQVRGEKREVEGDVQVEHELGHTDTRERYVVLKNLGRG